jgi:hypothetical protein
MRLAMIPLKITSPVNSTAEYSFELGMQHRKVSPKNASNVAVMENRTILYLKNSDCITAKKRLIRMIM